MWSLVASTFLLDKGKPSKKEISNFRLVRIWNIFIKGKIVLGTKKYLSAFVSAYRQVHGTQHVITKPIDIWKEKLNQYLTVGAILANPFGRCNYNKSTLAR